MLSAERIALLKHGAPPRNALEAALRNVWYGGGASYEKTVGPAPIISISDAKAKPAKSLIVGMEPIQAGSGDPSPDNIRPITGRTGVTVNHSGADTSDPQTYPVVFPDSVGTVYGGTVDVVSGVLTVDRYYFKSGWTQYNASNGFKAYRTQAIPYGRYANDNLNMPMSSVVGKFGSFSSGNMTENIIQPPRSNSNIAYMALDENLSPDDVDLTYLIAEPQTYQLTPQQIQLLKGSNVLWSDADDLTLTYIGTTPANLLGGMLGLGNTQEPIEETSEESVEEPVSDEPTKGEGE